MENVDLILAPARALLRLHARCATKNIKSALTIKKDGAGFVMRAVQEVFPAAKVLSQTSVEKM